MIVKDFKCLCGHMFEGWVASGSYRTKQCPACGKQAAAQIGAPAVMWHGKFWAGTLSHTAKSGRDD